MADSPRALFLRGLALVLVALVVVFPFYWMVVTSLKETAETLAYPPRFLGFTPTLDHYRTAVLVKGVGPSLINSLIVAGSTTAMALLLGAPAAYALARYEFRGKNDLWFWFIAQRMISPICVALPFFLIARTLNLIDTHLVLVLLYLTFTLPIVIWITTDQFRAVPRELDEAAMIDGLDRFQIFLRIALPLAAPGLAVSAILSFIFSWNELLFALILTRSSTRTAPVAATTFMSGYELPWGEIMATGTLIVLPVTVFALLVSRHLVRGLTMGAVK
jgi:multiple sugar transport system permease protein